VEQLSFKLGEVEGPLDLILQLISKNKLNIYDIEISSLLDQYLKWMDEMKSHDLEIASEFIEMAARLVRIKTSMLLPKHEEAETMKAELVGQLLEYSACKQAAQYLRERDSINDFYVRKPMPIERDMTYRLKHQPNELFESYSMAFGRGIRKQPPPVNTFRELVQRPIVEVKTRITYLLNRLYRSPRTTLKKLFEGSHERSELVATFLALLELVKDNRVLIGDDGEQITFNNRRKKGGTE
jgi:segregation and condensation protein A